MKMNYADVNYVGIPQSHLQTASQSLVSKQTQEKLGYLSEASNGITSNQATSVGLAGETWGGSGQTPSKSCPCCGYCSHCGRSNPNYPSYPQISYTSGNTQKSACNANTY